MRPDLNVSFTSGSSVSKRAMRSAGAPANAFAAVAANPVRTSSAFIITGAYPAPTAEPPPKRRHRFGTYANADSRPKRTARIEI